MPVRIIVTGSERMNNAVAITLSHVECIFFVKVILSVSIGNFTTVKIFPNPTRNKPKPKFPIFSLTSALFSKLLFLLNVVTLLT